MYGSTTPLPAPPRSKALDAIAAFVPVSTATPHGATAAASHEPAGSITAAQAMDIQCALRRAQSELGFSCTPPAGNLAPPWLSADFEQVRAMMREAATHGPEAHQAALTALAVSAHELAVRVSKDSDVYRQPYPLSAAVHAEFDDLVYSALHLQHPAFAPAP